MPAILNEQHLLCTSTKGLLIECEIIYHTSDQLVNRHLNTKYLVFLLVQFSSTPTHFSGQVSDITKYYRINNLMRVNSDCSLKEETKLFFNVPVLSNLITLICHSEKMSNVHDVVGQLIHGSFDQSIFTN